MGSARRRLLKSQIIPPYSPRQLLPFHTTRSVQQPPRSKQHHAHTGPPHSLRHGTRQLIASSHPSYGSGHSRFRRLWSVFLVERAGGAREQEDGKEEYELYQGRRPARRRERQEYRELRG